MEKEKFVEIMKGVKNGQFVKIHYRSVKAPMDKSNTSEYVKETETVVRFVEYANINGVVVKGGKALERDIENKYLRITKNGNYLVQVSVANIPNHKPTIKFMKDHNEITKDQFNSETKQSKPSSSPLVTYTIKLENLIALNY